MNPDTETPDVIAPAAATPDAPMTLTAEDLRQIRNGVISAITHSGDVQAFLDARFAAALAVAGVLTDGNIHVSAGLYARFEETTYEQVWKVIEEAGLGHRPPAP